jgi:DNA repair protein RecO (recombination protein O)
MLHKTRGIVLNYIKYRDTSVIVKIYTEEFGLQSYIINGIRSKASKKSLALLQPLSLLELVVYRKKNSNGGISRLSEYRSGYPFKSIPFDIKKSAIVLFISEWFSKTLSEEEGDHSGQFSFFFQSIKAFDNLTSRYENFHLQLMIKAADYFGFAIGTAANLLDEETITHEEMQVAAEKAIALGQQTYDQPLPISNTERMDILDLLIRYYTLHIESFGTIKSASVLKGVFHS